MIQYALTVNPTIYVSGIKQFWSSVSVKKVNDVVRLQALIDRRKAIITEVTVRQALHLYDAKSIDFFPNEEIFAELARMGVFANMRRVGKGFSGVDTPLFEGMLVPQQAADDVANVAADDIDDVVAKDAAEPTPPSPTPTTPPPPPPQELPSTSQDKVAQALDITTLKQRVIRLEKKNKLKVSRLRRLKKIRTGQRVKSFADTVMDDQEDASKQGGIIAKIDADEDVILEEVDDDDEIEPVELKELIEVVTTTKLMTEVVTAAATAPISAATIIATPSAARRRKRKQAHIKQDEAYAKELEAELNKNITWDDVIEQDLEEEESMELKRKSESSKEIAVKKKKFDEEVEELKEHLQTVPNDEDDIYTEATPLALKVPIVDYQIHTENNKRHYKIIRANGTHQLFLSFISLLRNFDREDLEMLWQIVYERFASSKPKNLSDNFLLNTLKEMFKKPDVEAII
nr:xylulose kinase-1 [Tanacetum cinerariifolium]